MHKLATEYWEQLTAIDPGTSRIHWSYCFISSYFFEGGLQKERLKDKSKEIW